VIAEGVGSIVEHGGGRLLISFYDLPWVPGLNERELGEVRGILVDAYLHPEKYETERNAVSLIKDILIKDPEKLTEKEKELQKLAEKALKGDEKAMEKIKEILEGDSQQKLANSIDLIERIKEGPHSLSNKEKQKFYVTALSPFIGTPKITKEDEILLLKALGDERLTDVESARLDELFKNNKSDILDYYQNTKKRLQRQLTIIPTLDRMLLFIYLSSPAEFPAELEQH
jgi:hypothetical protein